MFRRTNAPAHRVRSFVGTFYTTRGHRPERGSEFQTGLLDPACQRNRKDDISSTGLIQGRMAKHVQDVKRTCDN